MVDRLEALFHPEMRQKLGGRDHTTMRDFEAGLPRHQLDLCEPYGAHQYEILLRSCETHGAGEAEQPRTDDHRARFLQDLSAESLLPGFIALGTPSWPAPSLAILADQNDVIFGRHTESIRSMGSALRNCSSRVPGDRPLALIGSSRELFAVARYSVLQHCHPPYQSIRRQTHTFEVAALAEAMRDPPGL